MDKKTAKVTRLLKIKFPLIGDFIRKKGAEYLYGTSEKEAVEPLLELLQDKNEKVSKTAYNALTRLTGSAMNHFCTLWSETRDEDLEEILMDAVYIATSPLKLLYLTSLIQGELEIPASSEIEGITILLELINDSDSTVTANAVKKLHSLRNQEGINYLCKKWEESRKPCLETIITDAGYIASSPVKLQYITSIKQGELEIPANSEKEGIAILLGLLNDSDVTVTANTVKALHSLKNQEGINYLCSLWGINRDPELGKIIKDSGYIASDPELLHALTIFFQDKNPAEKPGSNIIRACLLDRDIAIVRNTVKYILNIYGKSSDRKLWNFIKEKPESKVAFCLYKMNWQPDDPSERALFYFLAGDLDAYHDIDFEQSHLRYWYEAGSDKLKNAISSRIRKNGDRRLLSIFKTSRGGRKNFLEEKDVDIQIEILLKNKEYSEVFNLLPQATFAQGKRIVDCVRQAGWEIPESIGRELQEQLEEVFPENETGQNLPSSHAMAIFKDFRPMFIGQEKVPDHEKILVSWLEDRENFRRRSAALVTLAERGYDRLTDAVNKACADPYWQVRMAAAGAELLKPGCLSPANRVLLEQDHVYWVQALLKLDKPDRLVDLGPQGLEELKREDNRSYPEHKPDVPDYFFDLIKIFTPFAEKEYLLTLAEYLGTDSTWSEDTAYDAGDTDVEIEFE